MPDHHPHDPVLLDRCVELLRPALTRRHADGTGAVLVDATLGAGGHAERFLTELPGLRLIGLDRDRTALAIAAERLAPFGDRVDYVQTRYDGFWADHGRNFVDGVLFDLGVSSLVLLSPRPTTSPSPGTPRTTTTPTPTPTPRRACG